MNALHVALSDRKFVGGLMEYQSGLGEIVFAEIGSIEIDGDRIKIHPRRTWEVRQTGLRPVERVRFVFKTTEENLSLSFVRCGEGPLFLHLPRQSGERTIRMVSLYPIGHKNTCFPPQPPRSKK